LSHNVSYIKIAPENLSQVMPFILATDKNMDIIWASEAILTWAKHAVGMNISNLIKSEKSHENYSPESVASKIGIRHEFFLLRDDQNIPLVGQWQSTFDGFIMLASPNAKSIEELVHFKFDDFAATDDLIDFLVARDENSKSLQEATLNAEKLKIKNQELETSKQELNQKLSEIYDQRKAFLNMMKDMEESRHQLELVLDDLQSQITERKKAEEDLKTFAAKLEQSNRELQEFASVASHDLQEPLRKVRAFGDRLKATCGDDISEKGRDYLQRMQSAAGRMQVLIEDLLTFSRVASKAQPFVALNLQKIAEEVISDLEITIDHLNGRVKLGKLPIIDADPIQMRQLLQNLIGNGLKFHKKNITPIVKVDSKIIEKQSQDSSEDSFVQEFCQIVVEDNGIGFDEKYSSKIFNVFQRLHSRSEYKGTGIGLAVCRKIIERHGGDITAESKPGKGAKFIITIPLKQRDVVMNDEIQEEIINQQKAKKKVQEKKIAAFKGREPSFIQPII